MAEKKSALKSFAGSQTARVLLLLVLLVFTAAISIHQEIDSKDTEVMYAWSQVEVHLVWRYQLVPVVRQLLETRGIDAPGMGHVVKAHGEMGRAVSVNDRISSYKNLEEGLQGLFKSFEGDQELQDDPIFKDVMEKVDRNHASILPEMKRFNEAAAAFNEFLTGPKGNLAKFGGYKPYLLLPEARSEKESPAQAE